LIISLWSIMYSGSKPRTAESRAAIVSSQQTRKGPYGATEPAVQSSSAHRLLLKWNPARRPSEISIATLTSMG
jgi:hypothetical protein